MARGSIRPRETATGTVYDVTYDVPAIDGKRHQRRKTCASKREAERVLAAQVAAVDRGDVRHTPRVTLGAYLDSWLAAHAPRLEGYTAAAYRQDLEQRIRPYLGDLQLRDVDLGLLRRWVAELDAAMRETKDGPQKRWSAKTINNAVTTLRVALGHAEDDGLIARSPGSGRRARLRLPDAHREMSYLSPDELRRYLAAAAPAYHPLAVFLVGTGCRIGEAVALRWSDVDLQAGAVTIHRAYKRDGSTGSTKSDKARRVEIGATLVALLGDRRARAGEHVVDLEAELVFPNRAGHPYQPQDISNRAHKQALAAARIARPVRLHDLRHSAAAAWIAAGLPLVFVQAQLGHATIATTMKHYGHLEPTYLRDAAALADQALFAPIRDMA